MHHNLFAERIIVSNKDQLQIGALQSVKVALTSSHAILVKQLLLLSEGKHVEELRTFNKKKEVLNLPDCMVQSVCLCIAFQRNSSKEHLVKTRLHSLNKSEVKMLLGDEKTTFN